MELIELALQLLGELLADGLLDAAFRSYGPVGRMIRACLVSAFAGAVFGGLSLLVFPEHIISNPSLRLICLICLPFANGFLMGKIGKSLAKREKTRSDFEHFLPAFCLSLSSGLVRFWYAS